MLLVTVCGGVLLPAPLRTLNGLGILVCSMDGTVAYLNFSQDELGDPLNEDEKVSQLLMSFDVTQPVLGSILRLQFPLSVLSVNIKFPPKALERRRQLYVSQQPRTAKCLV